MDSRTDRGGHADEILGSSLYPVAESIAEARIQELIHSTEQQME
ncbi:MAG: hypothetical protein AAF518_26420 [Spirochaetota bacterium]